MLKLEGTIQRCMYDSRRFFQNTRIVHIVLAFLLIAIGTTSLLLSNGSNGSAQVPYFFSAYIAAVWHLVFVVICQVCMYYLAEDGDRGQGAPTWVRAYSVSSSLFVLFNVMGVVFTVVNGICIEDQMCYYDKNMTSNRIMAIILILLHCVSIVLSVFLAKRSHLIDAELNNDIGIKLNHVMKFLRTRRQRSQVSVAQSDSRQTASPSQSSNHTDTGLSEVQNKGGHVLTTIEISAMAHRKTHRRSKSQPNMVKQLGLQTPENMKGQVVSIYSDTETPENDERERKKRKAKHKKNLDVSILSSRKRSKSENNVENLLSDGDSYTGSDKLSISITSRKQSITPDFVTSYGSTSSSVKNGGKLESDPDDNVLFVKSVGMDEAAYQQQKLLLKQAKLQKQQEKLFEEQRKLFLAQKQRDEGSSINGAPPPYDNSDATKDNSENRGDIML